MSEEQVMTRKTGEEVAREVSKMLNSFDDTPAEEFIAYFEMEHRTLQQNFTRLCVDWLKNLAARGQYYDARNEASVQLAKKLLPILEQSPLPLI